MAELGGMAQAGTLLTTSWPKQAQSISSNGLPAFQYQLAAEV